MKLKDLESILSSESGAIQRTIVYDLEKNDDLECGCSIEFAVTNYGEREVKRIGSCYESGKDYLIITI